MNVRLALFPAALALVAPASSTVHAQPVVTNATTSIYAVVPEPMVLDCAPDGTLYCGRNSGDGVAAFKIYQVAAGGWPAGEFGSLPILDPDALIVDAAGIVSGTPGSVLVGGVHSNPLQQGKISKIAPDGTVTTLFGPGTGFLNPTCFAFDGPGRLLFADYSLGRVMVTTGGTPTPLFSLPHAYYVSMDAGGRIAVTSADDTWLRLYTSAGVLSNATFATVKAGSPIARGPGGAWGTNLCAISTSGNLIRVDLEGNTTVLGSGFASITHFTFGPDGALYASDQAADRVYRIAPPAVPDCDTTIYARVTDPEMISFAPDGTLFAGRDNSGSGGNNLDAVKIHRIAPGGAPVTEFGNVAVLDPDAVCYDAAGVISGTPGAVIVGGVTDPANTQGKLSVIQPDGTVTTLFGPTTVMINPSDFVSDSSGRLVFTDYETQKLWVMTNGTPTVLVSSIPRPVTITVDAQDRILVNATTETRLRLYSAGGVLITNSFVPAQIRTPLALGPGGFWGTGVYYVNTNGDLMTVDLDGHMSKRGTGFSSLTDFAFGPDGALYASHFDNDCVWRIAPNAPTLTIVPAAPHQATISWSPNTPDFVLQETLSLSPTNWVNAPSGTTNPIVLPATLPAKFYRLFKP